jgi:mono/diheme cytochrome c family protein
VRRALWLAALCADLAACEARPPSGLESALLGRVKLHLTVGGRGDVNPLPDTAEVAARGQEAFSHYCVVCHGLDGGNTGVPFADAMSPPVPRLGSPAVQAYTDGQLHRVIAAGLWPSGMPASQGILDDEEIWSIVRYLRHLPPPGSLGEPEVYGGTAPRTSTPRSPPALP